MVWVKVVEPVGRVFDNESDPDNVELKDVDIERVCVVDRLSVLVAESVPVGVGVGGGVMVSVTVSEDDGRESDGVSDIDPETVTEILRLRLSVRAEND